MPTVTVSSDCRKRWGLDDEAIYELDGYMDFEKYGQDCMENDCVTKTEFGLLRRLDPPFPEQRQGAEDDVSKSGSIQMDQAA